MLADGDVRRFRNEATILERLRHPNTIRVFDSGETPGGLLYIVTELLEGGTLADEIAAHGALGERGTLPIALQVCRSLREVHSRDIVHRDLKPGNIYLAGEGAQRVVKVLDFGIARMGRGFTIAAPGQLLATLPYMSPEQAAEELVSYKSDLYALGVVMYECLTGVLPFPGPTPLDFVRQHTLAQPPTLRDVAPASIDPDTEALVMSLLQKDPARRPATAIVLSHQLESLFGQIGLLALPDPRPPPHAPSPAPQPSAEVSPLIGGGLEGSRAIDEPGRARTTRARRAKGVDWMESPKSVGGRRARRRRREASVWEDAYEPDARAPISASPLTHVVWEGLAQLSAKYYGEDDGQGPMDALSVLLRDRAAGLPTDRVIAPELLDAYASLLHRELGLGRRAARELVDNLVLLLLL